MRDANPRDRTQEHGAPAVRTERPRLNVRAGHENGRWFIVFNDGLLTTDGGTLDDALGDLIDALREYAAAWRDHLWSAPNHVAHRNLVGHVDTSTEAQLRTDILLGLDAQEDTSRGPRA